jgi:hypothetical protein
MTLNGRFGATVSEGPVPTTLEQRLLQLHVEESKKEPNPFSSNINSCSNLLTLVNIKVNIFQRNPNFIFLFPSFYSFASVKVSIA